MNIRFFAALVLGAAVLLSACGTNQPDTAKAAETGVSEAKAAQPAEGPHGGRLLAQLLPDAPAALVSLPVALVLSLCRAVLFSLTVAMWVLLPNFFRKLYGIKILSGGL